jgi:hypothetical protein
MPFRDGRIIEKNSDLAGFDFASNEFNEALG